MAGNCHYNGFSDTGLPHVGVESVPKVVKYEAALFKSAVGNAGFFARLPQAGPDRLDRLAPELKDMVFMKSLDLNKSFALPCIVTLTFYQALKQIISTAVAQSNRSFKEVALVEYPRKGLWALAFVTADAQGEMAERLSDEHVALFVPI